MCWASTNQNECKVSSKWGCSVLHENLKQESWHVESRIQNLSQAQVCAHRRVHTSRPHSQQWCRFSADLPSTCHMLLRPSHEASSLEEKSIGCLFPDPWWRSCEECTLEVNFNYSFPQQAHLFCPFREDSSFRWGQQLPPRPDAPFCKIGCFSFAVNYMGDYILSVSLNPKPVNSRKKPINTQYPLVTHNSDNISKGGRTGRIWAVGLEVFKWFDYPV